MKFETKKSEIDEFLHIGAAIAERRQTIPILSNLKMVAKNNTVEIAATDLEIQAIIKTNVNKVIEDGETTVSARKMSELCRSLPEDEILEFIQVLGSLASTGFTPLNHVPESSTYLSIKVVTILPDRSNILIVTLEFSGWL